MGKHVVETTEDNLERVRVTLNQFAPMTFFAERGGYSGHVYQPAINHREMLFGTFVDERQGISDTRMSPMNDSMVFPDEGNSFSRGHLMSLYFYEAQDGECNVPILSPAPLTYVDDGENGKNRLHIMGRMEGKTVEALTPETFEQTLKIFGLKRKSGASSKDRVSAKEVAEFMTKLGEHKLGTVQDLQAFVSQFDMGWLYEVTDEPIQKQLHYFAALLRALTPMRVAAYDGRHRFNLCCYFVSGNYNPSASLSMKEQNFEETFRRKVWKDGEDGEPLEQLLEVKYENCAVFQSQTVMVTLPKSNATTKAAFESMIRYGSSATANQALVVETTLNTLMPEFIQYLLSQPTLCLDKFNWTSYWSADEKTFFSNDEDEEGEKKCVIDRNMLQIWVHLMNFMNVSESRRKLMMGQTNSTFSIMAEIANPTKSNMANTNLAMDYQKKNGKTKCKNHLSTNFGIFLSSCKLLCDDLKNFVLLRRFLQCRDWTHLQGPLDPRDINLHGSVEYYQRYVLDIAAAATHIVTNRLNLEKALIEFCRNEKDNADLSIDLKTNWPNFTVLSQSSDLKIGKIKTVAASGEVSSTKLTPGSLNVTRKMEFAAHCTIFRDILETICTYGFNPVIKHREGKNQGLELYLG